MPITLDPARVAEFLSTAPKLMRETVEDLEGMVEQIEEMEGE